MGKPTPIVIPDFRHGTYDAHQIASARLTYQSTRDLIVNFERSIQERVEVLFHIGQIRDEATYCGNNAEDGRDKTSYDAGAAGRFHA
jgi:hypothetical protein